MRALLLFMSLLGLAAPARAQLPTIVLLPPDASRRLEQDVRVELQLAGREVRMMRGFSDELGELSRLADADVVAVERGGAGIVVTVVTGGVRVQERVPAGSPTRALAMMASVLLETQTVRADESSSPEGSAAAAPSVEAEGGAQGGTGPAVGERTAPDVTAGLRSPPPLSAPPPPRSERERVDAAFLTTPPPAPVPLAPVAERIGLEILGSVLLGGSLALGGALVADAVGGSATFPWWAVGLAITGTVGSTAGAFLAGRLTGAEGDPFWTLVSGVVGGGVGGLLMWVGFLTDVRPDDGVTSGWTYLGAGLSAVLPTALSVLAFELTVPDTQTPRVRLSPTGVSGAF